MLITHELLSDKKCICGDKKYIIQLSPIQFTQSTHLSTTLSTFSFFIPSEPVRIKTTSPHTHSAYSSNNKF